MGLHEYTDDLRVDIAIIGGGFTGTALAYHLHRLNPGMKVVLLEAETIGAGASGRTGGILLEGTAAQVLPATDTAVESLRQTIAREGIACELRLQGCYEMDRRNEIGLVDHPAPQWNDYGCLRPVQFVRGGDFHPVRYLRGIALAARERGAMIFERSPVSAIETDGSLIVRVADGWLQADWVIAATNTLLPCMGIAANFIPHHTYAIATAPVATAQLAELGWAHGRPFYTSGLPYLWGRTTLDGRIILGSGLSPIDHVREDFLQALEDRCHRLHSALADIPITHRWWGPICIPPDWTPKIIRSPRHPHLLYVGGYAGHGCALSHFVALRLAMHLTGDPTALQSCNWLTNGEVFV